MSLPPANKKTSQIERFLYIYQILVKQSRINSAYLLLDILCFNDFRIVPSVVNALVVTYFQS